MTRRLKEVSEATISTVYLKILTQLSKLRLLRLTGMIMLLSKQSSLQPQTLTPNFHLP